MSVRERITKIFNSTGMLNILYLPVLLFISAFIFYPFVRGFMVSFSDWNGFSPTYKLIGFRNYIRLFSDRAIIGTIGNTFIYAFGSTTFQNILGLSFALLLDKAIKGRNIVRTLIYMPVMVSGLIMGYIWYFMLQMNGGAINDIIIAFGGQKVDFLSINFWTVIVITAVNIFQHSGGCMIIYLAGLQTIPQDYYEAASIDGAKGFAMFRRITLPLLIPSVTICVITNLIGGLKIFDVIKALTDGGPGYMTQSLSTMMYVTYFQSQDAAYAATLGNFMFLIIVIISVTVLRSLRKREVQY